MNAVDIQQDAGPAVSEREIEIVRLYQAIVQSRRLWGGSIINTLGEKEISASELLSILQVPKANLSQHMTVLRQKGIVVVRREGNAVYYRLARPKILEAFDLMREILFEVLEEQRLLKEYGKKKE